MAGGAKRNEHRREDLFAVKAQSEQRGFSMPPPWAPPEPETKLTLPIPFRRLRYNLWCIGWTSGELARRLRVDESSIRSMLRGAKRAPDEVAIFVEQLATIHRTLWEPVGWEPAGRSSLKYMEVPGESDPDDTEVAPPHTRMYLPREHPDAPGSTNIHEVDTKIV